MAGLPPAGFRAAGAAGGGSGRRVPAWSQFCRPSPPGTRAQQAFLTCGRHPAAPACPPRRRQTAPQSPPGTRQLPDSHSSTTRCDVAAWLPLPGQETEAERGAATPPGHTAGRQRSSWANPGPGTQPTCRPPGAGSPLSSQSFKERGDRCLTSRTRGASGRLGAVQSSPPRRAVEVLGAQVPPAALAFVLWTHLGFELSLLNYMYQSKQALTSCVFSPFSFQHQACSRAPSKSWT